jgi:hypothetical protein
MRVLLHIIQQVTTISDLLAESNASQKLLIIIDGVDEALDADTCDISWVPLSLPLHVRLVISVTSESPSYHNLKVGLFFSKHSSKDAQRFTSNETSLCE